MEPMLPAALASEIRAIAADNVTGAMGLVRRAAESVLASAGNFDSPDALVIAADELKRSQPAMAPMFHLSQRLRAAARSGALGLADRISRYCGELLDQIERSDHAIAAHAMALFPDAAKVLTHSYSSTVAAVLEAAHRAGKLAGVIATESRPIGEGVHLARRIAGQGVPVDLIIDAAAALVLGETQLVLVGADSLSARGLVNKIGTHLIALAAREREIPFFAACSSLKIAPESFAPGAEPSRSPSEVLAGEIPGCRVRNYYFDTTPVDLLTGVVTENGIIKNYRGL
jgi:translation initiation factor eIF-2B subunit delta